VSSRVGHVTFFNSAITLLTNTAGSYETGTFGVFIRSSNNEKPLPGIKVIVSNDWENGKGICRGLVLRSLVVMKLGGLEV
jgi:hypothetical protein